MSYVIGVDGGSTKCIMKAKDLSGNLLSEVTGGSTNHLSIGASKAAILIHEQLIELLAGFGASKEDCRCIVAGAAGIDSPADKARVTEIYRAFNADCPVFCMNDAAVALYGSTKGVGISAISGTGSVTLGRNAAGKVTRSGGHSTRIFGDEGSSRWMALWALNYASKWLDGSVPASPLTRMLDTHFEGLDDDKLVKYETGLRTEPVDSRFAVYVYEAAKQGDRHAGEIIINGARELYKVAETCAYKLGFDETSAFKSGVWGSVFVNNEIFFDEYRRLFELNYPLCEVVFPEGDAADGAISLALDYLAGRADFIFDL